MKCVNLVVFLQLVFRILTSKNAMICSTVIRPVLKQTCLSDRIRPYLNLFHIMFVNLQYKFRVFHAV